MKLMFVVTAQSGETIAIAKSAVAVVIPMKKGCKIITNLVKSPYEGHVEYCVQENASDIIKMMNSNNG